MERPAKSGDDRRSVVVRLRVNMTERRLLEEYAAHAGLTLSDWIRTKTIEAKPLLRKPSPDKEVLLRLLAALGKVGSNLNQVARQLNRKQDSQEFIVPIETIQYTIEEIRAVINHLRNALDHAGH